MLGVALTAKVVGTHELAPESAPAKAAVQVQVQVAAAPPATALSSALPLIDGRVSGSGDQSRSYLNLKKQGSPSDGGKASVVATVEPPSSQTLAWLQWIDSGASHCVSNVHITAAVPCHGQRRL